MVATYLLGPSLALAQDEIKAPAEGEGSSMDTPVTEVGVDYFCKADIFYKWMANSPKPSNSKRGSANAAVQETFFVTAGEHGLIGNDVKKRLEEKLPSIMQQATKHCEDTYQSLTSCVTQKRSMFAKDYHEMDFQTRRELLKTATEDCKENLRVCKGARATEISCDLNKPPTHVGKKKKGKAGGEGGEK